MQLGNKFSQKAGHYQFLSILRFVPLLVLFGFLSSKVLGDGQADSFNNFATLMKASWKDIVILADPYLLTGGDNQI